jgi:hypothetical protein
MGQGPGGDQGELKCWAGPILAQFSRIIMLILNKKKIRAEINIFSGLFFSR